MGFAQRLRTVAPIYNALPITLLMLFFLLQCFLQLQCAYLQFLCRIKIKNKVNCKH